MYTLARSPKHAPDGRERHALAPKRICHFCPRKRFFARTVYAARASRGATFDARSFKAIPYGLPPYLCASRLGTVLQRCAFFVSHPQIMQRQNPSPQRTRGINHRAGRGANVGRGLPVGIGRGLNLSRWADRPATRFRFLVDEAHAKTPDSCLKFSDSAGKIKWENKKYLSDTTDGVPVEPIPQYTVVEGADCKSCR